MKLRLLSWLAEFVFMAGVLLQLSLSSMIVWAEIEAAVHGTQMTASSLSLNCPLVLSSFETGTVTTAVTNTSGQQVLPVVTMEISTRDAIQHWSETLSLAPHETRTIKWSVDDSDVIFGRLILVNVIQAQYRDLDPRRGFCGILVFTLFNLTGHQSLILVFAGGIALIIMGGTFWIRIHSPLDHLSDQTIKACGGLAGVTTLAVLAALPRWWGLTLALDAFALIMLSVIFTEFLLFPSSDPD